MSSAKALILFRFFLVITSLGNLSLMGQATSDNSVQIVREMFMRTKEISAMSYYMKNSERVSGKMTSGESFVKLIYHPFQIYIKQQGAKNGLEVLYVQGTNKNMATINPNGFPWVNVNLDPMGGTMRENQHHTIFESGYNYLMSILEHLTTKYQKELEHIIVKNDPITWDGHECWVVSFINPHFKYLKYTVQKGETILTIAHKYKVSEEMIMGLNPALEGYNEVKEGQVIQIPNDYASKLELYIEKSRKIPLVMKVYDDKGLFEYYEYSNVKLNPAFAPDEFKKTFKEYSY